MGLVLDGVVKHPGLAHDPFPDAVAHAEVAAWRHDERQVADEPRVAGAHMGRDHRLGLEQREHGHWRAPSLVRARCGLQQPCRFRATRHMFGNRSTVLPQVVGAPARVAVQFGPLLHRLVFRVLQIGGDVLVVLQHGQQFIADAFGAGLHGGQPREAAAVEELHRHQLRYEVAHGLRVVAALAAQQDVHRQPEARQVFARCLGQCGLQGLVHEGGQALLMVLPQCKRMGHGFAQVGRELGHRRCHHGGRDVDIHGLGHAPCALVEPSPHQQGQQVLRIFLQRLVQGALLREHIAPLLMHQRHVDPGPGIAATGRGGMGQVVSRALQVALRMCPTAQAGVRACIGWRQSQDADPCGRSVRASLLLQRLHGLAVPLGHLLGGGVGACHVLCAFIKKKALRHGRRALGSAGGKPEGLRSL